MLNDSSGIFPGLCVPQALSNYYIRGICGSWHDVRLGQYVLQKNTIYHIAHNSVIVIFVAYKIYVSLRKKRDKFKYSVPVILPTALQKKPQQTKPTTYLFSQWKQTTTQRATQNN